MMYHYTLLTGNTETMLKIVKIITTGYPAWQLIRSLYRAIGQKVG